VADDGTRNVGNLRIRHFLRSELDFDCPHCVLDFVGGGKADDGNRGAFSHDPGNGNLGYGNTPLVGNFLDTAPTLGHMEIARETKNRPVNNGT